MRLIPDDTWAVMTIWQEARGELQDGKIAVAEVIRNRMRARYSSDGTVVGTVLRAYQFSGWNTKDPNRIPAARLDDADPVVRRCYAAWEAAAAGSNLTRGALLYYAPLIVAAPDWVAECVEVAVIGRHRFLCPRRLLPA